MGEVEDLKSQRIVLRAEELCKETFAPFGQVITSMPDDHIPFDKEDAQLILDQGTPRFYIMRLPRRTLSFDRITHHAKVTQCLGGLQQDPWYMAVSEPFKPPTKDSIKVFKIPHGKIIKLHIGTWHAGPLFADAPFIDFVNLELADTNQTDHHTHFFKKQDGIVFDIVDDLGAGGSDEAGKKV